MAPRSAATAMGARSSALEGEGSWAALARLEEKLGAIEAPNGTLFTAVVLELRFEIAFVVFVERVGDSV